MSGKRAGDIITAALFCCFLAGLGILHLVLPDREFSETENRYLAQFPQYSWSRMKQGLYTSDIETYLEDQFPFRDDFMSLKTKYEYVLGKREFNDVYLCDGTLISEVVESENSLGNLEHAALFQKKSKVPVFFGLIPTAAEIWKEKLPTGAPSFDQESYIQEGKTRLNNCVDIRGYLLRHKEEPIYYRTDHHWTSLGAYYGYLAFMEAMGRPAMISISAEQGELVASDFNGTLYSRSGVHWLRPDTIETYIKDEGIKVTVDTGKQTVEHGLYVEDKLKGKDKYGYFLGGNNPLVIIKNENAASQEKLLIIRDSYSDSMAPFFSQEFSEVHLIDPRYFRESVSDYAANNKMDFIYICYSVDNFQKDSDFSTIR